MAPQDIERGKGEGEMTAVETASPVTGEVREVLREREHGEGRWRRGEGGARGRERARMESEGVG